MELTFNNRATTALNKGDIDFVFDKDSGQVWVLHGKPLPIQKDMTAASFAAADGTLTLHAAGQHDYALPVTVKPPLIAAFAEARAVTIVWTDKGEVFAIHSLPLHQQNAAAPADTP